MNEGAVSAELGLAGWPAVAEEAIIARDVLLAERPAPACTSATSPPPAASTSSAGRRRAASPSRPRSRRTTCCSPTNSSRRATRDGRVRRPVQGEPAAAPRRGRRRPCAPPSPTARSTSSRPTTPRTRSRRRSASGRRRSFGMVGLESALSVVQQAVVDTGLLDVGDVARVLSRAPAAIGRLDGYGAPLAVGSPAPPHALRPGGRRRLRRRAPARQERQLARTSVASCRAGSSRRSTAACRRCSTACCREPEEVRPWIGSRSPSSSSSVVGAGVRGCSRAAGVRRAPAAGRARHRSRRRPPSSASPRSPRICSTSPRPAPARRSSGSPSRGLGFRSRADRHGRRAGIVLDLAGERPRLPPEADDPRRRPRHLDDRPRRSSADGLVFVRWVLGGTEVDSYLRPPTPTRLVTPP